MDPAPLLPPTGAVAGIDVGYSQRAETTGLCLLRWDAARITWDCRNAGTSAASRAARLAELLPGDRAVLAVGIDGPLMPGLAHTGRYRACEAILSRGLLQRRGKPGATSGGSGPALHRAATALARFALEHLHVAPTTHAERIDAAAVFETFPNLFLGTLCDEATYPPRPLRRRRWTDTLFPIVRPKLEHLVQTLLPRRRLDARFGLRDHEKIAALTCAVSALCLAAGRYTAVGAAEDGFIVLPPRELLGAGWWETLDRNVSACRADFPAAELRFLPRAEGRDRDHTSPGEPQGER